MDSSQAKLTRTILTAALMGGICVISLVSVQVEAESNFTVQPVSVIQADGLVAVFECRYPGDGVTHIWYVNVNFRDEHNTTVPKGNERAVFRIPAKQEFNNTVVHCSALLEVGGQPLILSSVNVSLTVQGPLESVSALNTSNSVSSILISWMPPFSLNLTTAEPDIVYCVEVYNVTGEKIELVKMCNIIETSYLFSPANPSPDHFFQFIITPVSNVTGSRKGTSSRPVQASTCRRQSNKIIHNVEFRSYTTLNPMTFTYSTENGSDACMPTSYRVVFRNDSGPYYCSAEPTVTKNKTLLTFTNSNCTHEIVRHRLYNIIIVETYMGDITISEMMEYISTHDVQNPIVTNSSGPGQISISADYLGNSTDDGLFCVLYSLGDSLQVYYGATLMNNSKNYSVTSLPQNEYMVALYDLEELPQTTPAALPQRVSIANSQEVIPVPNIILVGTLQATSPIGGEVCVICSVTDCVGVIHSMDLNNLTLYHFRNGGKVSGLDRGNYSVVQIKRNSSGSIGRGQEAFSFHSTTVYVDSPLTTSESTPTVPVTATQGTDVVDAVVIIVVFVIISLAGIVKIVLRICFYERKSKTYQHHDSSVCGTKFSSTAYLDETNIPMHDLDTTRDEGLCCTKLDDDTVGNPPNTE